MDHENWTMIGVTRCFEVASWPSFFPLAKSCRSRVCWVDMASPLKQMAQFWSNYTPWIKLTVCTSKNWHLGRQSFFFCDTAYFQGRKLLVVWRLFGSIFIRGTKKLLQRHQGNSTFAQWCISCSWSGVMPIGTTFFITIFLDWEMINLHFPTQHPRMGNFQKPTNILWTNSGLNKAGFFGFRLRDCTDCHTERNSMWC